MSQTGARSSSKIVRVLTASWRKSRGPFRIGTSSRLILLESVNSARMDASIRLTVDAASFKKASRRLRRSAHALDARRRDEATPFFLPSSIWAHDAPTQSHASTHAQRAYRSPIYFDQLKYIPVLIDGEWAASFFATETIRFSRNRAR